MKPTITTKTDAATKDAGRVKLGAGVGYFDAGPAAKKD